MLADLSGEKPQMNMNALYKLTLGLYILGCRDGKRPVGSVVDAVMQVAHKPWMIALSCTNGSYTKQCIDATREFSLSVLSKKVEPWIIANFGFQSSKKVDKWSITKYHVKDGLPYLDDNIATLKCEVVQSISYESNTLFLAEVADCEDNKNEEPLTYNDYRAYFKQDVMDSFNKLKSAVKEKKWLKKIKKTKANIGFVWYAVTFMTAMFRLKNCRKTGFARCVASAKTSLPMNKSESTGK